MTIAVTGATGFVGRNLISLLSRDTTAGGIRALVRDPESAVRKLPQPGLEFRAVDVTKRESLHGAFDGCDVVVHTVAIPTERTASFASVNVEGTRNVVAEAMRAGVKRIVHIAALGADPGSPYPYLRSKGVGQRIVKEAKIASVILRPSLLFGPGDDFFPRLGFTLKFPIVPVPGDGKARFQPLHVEDLAMVLRAAMGRDDVLGVHDLGGPEVVSYDELLLETMHGYQKHRPTIHLPLLLMKPGAFVMERLLADPPVTVGQLDLLKTDNTPKSNAIEQVFGVRPRSIRGQLSYLKH